MIKEIEIEMEGAIIVGRLLDGTEWGQAPKTCSAMLKNLPINVEAIHSMWSGECIVVESEQLPEVEMEGSATPFLSQGDIGLVINRTRTVGEIIVVYGRRASLRGRREGTENCNVFAIVRDTDSIEKFAEVCRRIRKEGAKKISIRVKK